MTTSSFKHPNGASDRVPSFTPVFRIDETWDESKSAYPPIWITAPAENPTWGNGEREFVEVYPDPDYFDEEGWDALQYGAEYYTEGMGYGDAEDHEKRVDCFRAAELLYLHAAEKGNVIAWLNLGYVYSYDRCKGNYYRNPHRAETDGGSEAPYPREERAFECFKKAADAGMAEGSYKLGDMYKHGIGCQASAQEAFACYARAAEQCAGNDAVTSGSIALRLGSSYENAFGCEQSFAKALKWYERAAADLEIAVNSGEWFYKKALASAKDGVARCKQEQVD